MKKYLIGSLACFGDCIFATTIAKQIKEDEPSSHITWAIASKYKSILNNNPHVDVVWEIPIVDGDYYEKGWQDFENEANKRKDEGIFDEIIYSQIHPKNWLQYNGTIRSTILQSYNRPITVSKEPVVILSEQEKNKVAHFVEYNKLNSFKQVILFECSPGSKQSNINFDLAFKISKFITDKYKDVCIILSSPNKINSSTVQIIDASSLSFRENAALLNYCNLLLGCSSGITWLNTSTASNKTNTIQFLQEKASIFAGVYYDLEANKLNNSYVMEVLDIEETKAIEIISFYIENNFQKAKEKYHTKNEPNFYYFSKVLLGFISKGASIKDLKRAEKNHQKNNIILSGNRLKIFKRIYITRTIENLKNVMKKNNKLS